MSDRRNPHWAVTSARVAVGTTILAAAVVGAVVAVVTPWPRIESEPARVVATPAPADTVLACDGPLLALGRSAANAGEITVVAPQRVVSGPAEAGASSHALSAAGGAEPQSLVAPPEGDRVAELAAAGSSSVDSPDIRGFAASSCRPALLESWLVGGTTTTGANDLVVLSNPGAVPATVQLTVFGSEGAVTPPGGTDRVVAARSQLVIPLAGLVLNEQSPVVRVTATGAPVRASLQTSMTRLLTAAGLDQVAAIPAAGERQVIPAVTALQPAEDGTAPAAATSVRMLSPTADTTATVRVVPAAEGAATPDPVEVPLAAGVPSELDLSGVPAGRYAVVVDADSPVVAAAWQTTGFGAGSDFAWMAAAPPIEVATVFAVPDGASPTLTVANPGGEPASVVLTAVGEANGGSVPLEIPAGGAASVALAQGTVYRLEPAAPVHAGVSMQGEGALAAYPLWPADAAAQPIVVYP